MTWYLENLPYSPEPEEGSSEACSADSKPSRRSKSIPTVAKSCSDDSSMDAYRAFLCGTMSALSTVDHGEASSMSSPEGFPVRISPVLAPVQGSLDLDPRSGLRCSGSSEKSDPHTCSSKILHASGPEDWERSSKGLPLWGMMRAGVVSALKTSVPHIAGGDSGSLPTPTKRDWRSGKAGPETMARNSRPLSEVVGGLLNPEYVEWLMGVPIGWTALNASAMLKYRLWLDSHGRS